jgi:hypothetical protein
MNWLTKIKAVFVTNVPDKSDVLKVDTTDLAKVVRTAILLGVATSGVEILSYLKPEMFGDHSSVAAVVMAMTADFLMRFLKNNGKTTNTSN